jgi:hypothetical protein
VLLLEELPEKFDNIKTIITTSKEKTIFEIQSILAAKETRFKTDRIIRIEPNLVIIVRPYERQR